jgi:hypothetical protein
MPRPRLKPTDEQRRLVKSLAAMGTPHTDIARKIGVSPKTLRKYFRKELEMGAVEANYKVAQTLFQMAISGEHPACTIFWVKTRNRFRERPDDHAGSAPPPPFVVGLEPGDPGDDQT